MKHGNNIMGMPDDSFPQGASITDKVRMGWHEEALMRINSAQFDAVISFMNNTGVFVGDSPDGELDVLNDVITHLPLLSGSQYAQYVQLVTSFDGRDGYLD